MVIKEIPPALKGEHTVEIELEIIQEGIQVIVTNNHNGAVTPVELPSMRDINDKMIREIKMKERIYL